MTDYNRLRTVLEMFSDVATGEVGAHVHAIGFRVDLSKFTMDHASKMLDFGFKQSEWWGPDWYVTEVLG